MPGSSRQSTWSASAGGTWAASRPWSSNGGAGSSGVLGWVPVRRRQESAGNCSEQGEVKEITHLEDSHGVMGQLAGGPSLFVRASELWKQKVTQPPEIGEEVRRGKAEAGRGGVWCGCRQRDCAEERWRRC